MPDAGPSRTAQGVAAFRLGLEREASDVGDPLADEALARDVAADAGTPDGELFGRHLTGRTRFFDRVVVGALERGVEQIVLVGAGYDGRPLRYGAAGVRWWEVDLPATQTDKRERLNRLGIATPDITFVAHDLEAPGLGTALTESGLVLDAPALLCCEGVLAYLSREGARQTLAELRALAMPGTRLAVSLALESSEAPSGGGGRSGGRESSGGSENGEDKRLARRAARHEALRALGEPPQTRLVPVELDALLADTRWRAADISERARRAGFFVLVPVWSPAGPGRPATRGRLGRYAERMLHRAGDNTLSGHLEATYGVTVRSRRELDLGVHRVELQSGGSWIVRVFPASRSPAAARADARLLTWHRDTAGFPAERPPAVSGPTALCRPVARSQSDEPPATDSVADAVSIHAGQPVLVTERASGRHLTGDPPGFRRLGELLGRLHSLPSEDAPASSQAGAWHHLILDASPAEEIVALRDLLDAARHRVPRGSAGRFERLLAAVDAAEAGTGAGLPHALGHPDFVPRNVLCAQDGSVTVVDWTGAGVIPRVVTLGCLLWAAAGGGRAVAAAVAGYRATGPTITSAELDRLSDAIRLRPLVLAGWTFATGRGELETVVDQFDGRAPKLDRAADSARALLAADG